MKIKVEGVVEAAPSKSHNVNRYVRAVLAEQALFRALEQAKITRVEAYRKLTGGKIAEADRILREAGAR